MPAFQKFSGTSVIPLDTYSGQVSVGKFLDAIGSGFSSWVSYALIIGLFVNIILIALRKWTNVHSLMITGHVMFQQAAVVVPVIFVLMFSKGAGLIDEKGVVSLGAQLGNNNIFWITIRCLLRCCFISYNQRNWCSYTKCWFCSWPPTNVWCFAIAYKIGKYFGKAEQSSENRKMPKGLKVFEDNIFTQAVLILLVFLILILIIQFAPGLDESVRFAGKNGLVTNGYGPWKVGGKQCLLSCTINSWFIPISSFLL